MKHEVTDDQVGTVLAILIKQRNVFEGVNMNFYNFADNRRRKDLAKKIYFVLTVFIVGVHVVKG